MLIDDIKLGKPALRALHNLGIETLEQLTEYSDKELLALHGFGPKALSILKAVIQDNNLSRKEENGE